MLLVHLSKSALGLLLLASNRTGEFPVAQQTIRQHYDTVTYGTVTSGPSLPASMTVLPQSMTVVFRGSIPNPMIPAVETRANLLVFALTDGAFPNFEGQAILSSTHRYNQPSSDKDESYLKTI